MTALLKHTWLPFPDAWALSLTHFPAVHGNAFVSSSSSGALALFSLEKFSPSPVQMNRRAHDFSINAVDKIDEFTLALAASDGIRVWDLRQSLHRPQMSLSTPKKPNFLSLASSKNNLLAAGTELVGVDAELHLWDLKSPGSVVRSFVDSHHDDITAVQFHKSLPYLISGSTDGYVNVYNLEEPDEEEALHQVINFASVHQCLFTRPNRIAALSHMETLGFYELNDTNYEVDIEPKPKEIGDVRSIWPDCEYVIDLNPQGHVSYGANLEQKLTLMPFDPVSEQFNIEGAIQFPLAHGEEVVRDVLCVPGTNTVVTCGEDGNIKAWEAPQTFLDISAVSELVKAPEQEESMEVEAESAETEVETEKQKKKREKKEKKEKKEKRDKSDRKDKKKLKTDVRFKPY